MANSLQTSSLQMENPNSLKPVTPKPLSGLQGKAQKIRQQIALAVMIIPTLGFMLALQDGWNLEFSAWKIILLAVFYVGTLFGVEAGFHRLISHNAYVTPLRNIIVILGSMAVQGPVIFWAAAHRQHHAFSDDMGDPHSPRSIGAGKKGFLQGMWHGHMGWLIKAESVDWARFAPDLLKDRTLFRLNQMYLFWVLLGLVLPSMVGALVMYFPTHSLSLAGLGAWEGFLWGGLARIFLVHHAVWAVNSFCHISGNRPFACKGTATNNIWLALPSLGGAWHNNHHAFPFTADNQFAWWQFDFCGLVLQALKKINLLTQLKKPSLEAISSRRLIKTLNSH